MSYRIEYSPQSADHLQALPAQQKAEILDKVDEQLVHEPTVETRNRKPMRPNPLAPWELRIGNLRVYYDVEEEAAVVQILAVGVKEHNRLFIGGEEIEL